MEEDAMRRHRAERWGMGGSHPNRLAVRSLRTAAGAMAAAVVSVLLASCIQLSPTSLQFDVSPSALSFRATVKGGNPAAKTVAITNAGIGTLSGLAASVRYDAKGSGWLSVSLSSTTAPSTLTVQASLGTLTADTYTATISVSAADAVNSPQTVSVSLVISGPTGPPAAPSGVTAAAVSTGDGQVSVSWSPVSGATSYNLYWKAGGTVSKTSGTKITGVSAPAIVDNIPQGTEYAFTVTAANSAGESTASSVVTATLPTTTSHVYIAGWDGPHPAYWRDGVLVQLPIPSGANYGWLFSVAPTATKVYAAGGDDMNPVVYNNGTSWTTLTTTGASSFGWFADLSVSPAGDVYLTAEGRASGAEVPLLWENGNQISLATPAGTGGVAGGIVFSGSDIIIAGYTYGGTFAAQSGSHIGAWIASNSWALTSINATANSNGEANIWINGIGSSGVIYYSNDFYSWGNSWDDNDTDIPLWSKDGGAIQYGTLGQKAISMAASGSDFYSGGSTTSGFPYYSKNGGAATVLSGSQGSVEYIAVSGSTVYTVGYGVTLDKLSTKDNALAPLYWVNAVPKTLPLPSGDDAVIFHGMIANGADVYITGETGTYDSSASSSQYLSSVKARHAVYWKNGILSVLPLGGAQNSGVDSIRVSSN